MSHHRNPKINHNSTTQVGRFETSGLNVETELDGLFVGDLKLSGLKVDSELGGLSVAHIEIPD